LENKTINLIDNAPVAILTFNKNGEIDYINRAFSDLELLYGLEYPNTLIGSNILNKESIPNLDSNNELNEVLKGIPFEKELITLESKTSNNINLIIKGAPIYDAEEIVGGIIIIEDIKILTKTKREIALRSDFIENAVHNVADFFIVVDRLERIQFFSKNILNHINISGEPIQGTGIGSLFDLETSTIIKDFIDYAKQNRKAITEKISYKNKGIKKVFEIRFVPQENYRKEISFIYLFFKDISATEREIDTLYKTVEHLGYYQTISAKSGNALFVLGKENRIEYWDDGSEKLYEKSKDEVLGIIAQDAVSILSNTFLESLKTRLAEKETHKIIITYFDRNRDKKTYEINFAFLDQKREKLLVKSIDITDKIHFEEGIKSSLKSLRQLIAKSPSMVCNLDRDGQIIFSNESFQKTFGYTEEELLSRSFYELIDPIYLENNILDLKNFVGDEPKQIELPLKTKNEDIINLKATFFFTKDSENQIQSLGCYLTELKSSALKEEPDSLYHLLVESASDGLALGCEGKIIIANNSFAKIFGYGSGNEMINKEIIDLASNDDILKVAEYLRVIERKKDTPIRFDFLGKKKDSSSIHSELSIASFEFNRKKYIVMIARDITERIRSQRAIKESEEKYRNITENIDDFLFTFERIGLTLRPIFATSSIQKVSGYTQTDFLSDSKLFLKVIHPDDYKNIKPKLINLLKSRIQLSSEFEFRLINKQGNIVWVRAKINLVRSGTGRIQKVFGLVSDITFRKRAEEELKKSTQNLIKLNETKDRFISIISHDLRTPFSSILGFTDLLANDEELTEEERKQYVRYIQESAISMLSLVNSLLDWTRLQTGRIKFEPQKIDVTKIIADSINTLSGAVLQKDIQISSNISQFLYLFVDKSLITQVFNNLISNAIKFTNRNGSIIISAEPANNSRFIQFSVKDTGVGIKEEDIPKLFNVDSKFTSEGTAGEKGSGLGLSLVKEIIEKHGGTIWVESKFGQGSDFKFTLPIASSNILIVDDSKTDRLLYSKILKNISPEYSVEIASNGKEAIEKILLSPPALVITDHLMPVMNGYEFVMELKKLDIKGKPPVIVLSSDIDRAAINEYNELGIEFVFHKPVNLSSFKKAVEKSLQKGLSSD
jgi:PAS domain S-box-containing protein